MDKENVKLVVAALVIVSGSNATGILNAYNPDFRADGVTMSYVNAAISHHEQETEKISNRLSSHVTAQHGDLEHIRGRLLECEFNLRVRK